jgi:hypothetical protein
MQDSPLRRLANKCMDRHLFEERAVEEGLCDSAMDARRAWFEIAPELTRGDILKMITAMAQKYVPFARKSVLRNSHMHRYTGAPGDVPQTFVEAVVVDFINFVSTSIGVDYGLCTKHLAERERITSVWEHTICRPHQLAAHLNMLLASQPDSERKALFDTITDGYCAKCGAVDNDCYCGASR